MPKRGETYSTKFLRNNSSRRFGVTQRTMENQSRFAAVNASCLVVIYSRGSISRRLCGWYFYEHRIKQNQAPTLASQSLSQWRGRSRSQNARTGKESCGQFCFYGVLLFFAVDQIGCSYSLIEFGIEKL